MHNVHQPIRSEYRYKLTIESTEIEARSITNPIEHRSHYNHNHLINLYPINSLCIDRPPTTIHTLKHSFSLVSMPFFDIHGSVPSSWLNATECWHWSHLSALLARGLLDVWRHHPRYPAQPGLTVPTPTPHLSRTICYNNHQYSHPTGLIFIVCLKTQNKVRPRIMGTWQQYPGITRRDFLMPSSDYVYEACS